MTIAATPFALAKRPIGAHKDQCTLTEVYSMIPRTDQSGRVLELRCHDGYFTGLDIRDSEIELRFRRIDATKVQVVLHGIRSFAMDRFLEGNIVDTAYVWRVAAAPKCQRHSASEMFLRSESFLDQKNGLGANKLFVLESSYGAKVYALVREIEIIDDKLIGELALI